LAYYAQAVIFDKILLPGKVSVRVLACIPARYGSTRFTGKVLARNTGKFLIQHTWERACQAKLPERVIIAADDQKIIDAAESFGAECLLTSTEHKSGTDRTAEALANIDVDIVINLQADEPEIDPQNIDLLARILIEHPEAPMATLAADFQNAEQIANPDIVKIVVTNYERRATSDEIGRAVYFSRSVIPYDREQSGIGEVTNYLRHVGIYAYRKAFLLEITKMPQTKLEKIEKLEQLRVIENGFAILVGKVEHTCGGIDTPQQYAEFVKRYQKR